jgi:hypothetical protein
MIAAAEEIDPTKVTPGAGGLLVFIFLLVAGYFLFRSLKKQLNKVDFPEESGQEPTPTPGERP